jgi:hypothetical protein
MKYIWVNVTYHPIYVKVRHHPVRHVSRARVVVKENLVNIAYGWLDEKDRFHPVGLEEFLNLENSPELLGLYDGKCWNPEKLAALVNCWS